MKNLALNSDYVVCLSLETTQPASQVNYRRVFHDDRLATLSKTRHSDTAKQLDLANLNAFVAEQGANLPRLVHLDWTICSVKEFKVLEVASVYVNPDQAIDDATTSFTGLTQDVISKEAVSFSDALQKFGSSVKSQIGDKIFQVLTQADWVSKYQLALDSARTGTSLPEGLKNCTNVFDLHFELLPEKPAHEVSDLLSIHELEPIQGPTRAKTNSQSLVRLVNRMIRHYKVQSEMEKTGPTSSAAAGSHISNESTEDSKMVDDSTNSVKRRSRSRSSEKLNQNGEESGFGRSKRPVNFEGPEVVALKLRGIPFQAQVSDVITFFHKWNVEEDRVEMIIKDDGRFSGIALVLLDSPEEAQEALNEMQGQNIGHRWIEIFPISYDDFKSKDAGYKAGGHGDSNRGSQKDVLISKYLNPSNVGRCVKLGGLPFRVRTQEVQDFFRDFDVADNDIVIEQKDGRRTGYGIVFLKDEGEVDQAISSLHKQYIGSRFIYVFMAGLRRGGSRDDDY